MAELTLGEAEARLADLQGEVEWLRTILGTKGDRFPNQAPKSMRPLLKPMLELREQQMHRLERAVAEYRNRPCINWEVF